LKVFSVFRAPDRCDCPKKREIDRKRGRVGKFWLRARRAGVNMLIMRNIFRLRGTFYNLFVHASGCFG